jgi:pyruvate/2-oxoglutarate dehydrogenase complex dihydrolipoamide acyltransferase (E2) component
MPGSIVGVAVQSVQRVSAGSTLIAMEAMKMETHIAAQRDCVIAAVYVQPGDRVAAKDLLVELEAANGRVVAFGAFAPRIKAHAPLLHAAREHCRRHGVCVHACHLRACFQRSAEA